MTHRYAAPQSKLRRPKEQREAGREKPKHVDTLLRHAIFLMAFAHQPLSQKAADGAGWLWPQTNQICWESLMYHTQLVCLICYGQNEDDSNNNNTMTLTVFII